MNMSLPRPSPEPVVLSGRYCHLEPLDLAHAEHLYAASAGEDNRPRFDYLFELPPRSVAEVHDWIASTRRSHDKLWSAVIDIASGRCEGRQALLNINPDHGTIELGGIYWGPAIARSRVATEAAFLHMQYAFDDLGYRRFEWKCNDQNAASKRAAERFGFTFEGVFRQHMVVKGNSRDSAWYSIIDTEWPRVRNAFDTWLQTANFDTKGRQLRKLAARSGMPSSTFPSEAD